MFKKGSLVKLTPTGDYEYEIKHYGYLWLVGEDVDTTQTDVEGEVSVPLRSLATGNKITLWLVPGDPSVPRWEATWAIVEGNDHE